MKKSVIAVIFAVMVCAGTAYGEYDNQCVRKKNAAYAMKTYLDGEAYLRVDVTEIYP